jgi:nucleoid-associated protein YgaU
VALAEPATVAAVAAPEGEGLNFSIDSPQAVQTVRTRPPATTPTRPPATSAPVVRTTPPPTTPTVTRPATPAPTIRTPPPAATAARRHTIKPGDTLFKLAQQYYNNRAKWRDIYAANRDVMKSETDLRAGMVLKIP